MAKPHIEWCPWVQKWACGTCLADFRLGRTPSDAYVRWMRFRDRKIRLSDVRFAPYTFAEIV